MKKRNLTIAIFLSVLAGAAFLNMNAKALEAPGGGSRSPEGVNVFQPSPDPLSTSNITTLNAHIELIKRNLVEPLMRMTEQLSAVGMQQMLTIGQFYDAKMQIETQRLHQTLKAEAVKDYHPSEEMCKIGSYIRSVAATEQKAEADKRAMNEIMMSRVMNEYGGSTGGGFPVDIRSRLNQFRTTYCNPKDNNDALGFLCEHDQDGDLENGEIGASDTQRMNKDINYFATMAFPATLDIEFQDNEPSPAEEDVIALAKNLYWPEPFTIPRDRTLSRTTSGFLSAKRIIALNNIAYASYANLAGMKARAPEPAEGVEPGWAFMKTMLKDFGIDDEDEIEKLIGKQPSYWAQMEILTKKIYQNPNFYTNLYDKPNNVERMSVALEAIKLMQMRDHFDSSLRQEMLTSAMVETELDKQVKRAQTALLTQPE